LSVRTFGRLVHRCRAGLLACAAVLLVVGGAHADEQVRATLRATDTEATLELVIAPGWHVNATAPRDEFLIPTSVTLTPPAGVTAGPVRWPEPVDRALAFSGGKPMLLFEGTVRATAALSGKAAPGAGPLRATLRYQACSDTTCLPPKTVELEAAPPDVAAAAMAGGLGRGGQEIADVVARFGWGLTFLWIAMVGLALNLTPCVYPLISVTVAFFGGRTGTDSGRAVRHAVVYVLGICLTFSALGVAAALTGSLFGAAMQQPAVLGGIALLMAGLALGNFGLYQVRMPSAVLQWAGRAGEGYLGALFMGLTMGVVGAPCIGPIVAALLLFVGSQQSAALGFTLFFVLGLGMGLPYVALAALAGRLRRLPRSGAWLAWVEWLFGFMLLGLAIHFATPLLPDHVVKIAWALLLVTAGVVQGFVGSGGSALGWMRRAAGVAVIVLGLVGLGSAERESEIAWTPFSDAALQSAVSAGRPVLIDFQAAWCLPCREMERTTFRDPAVVRAAESYASLKADVTEQDAATEALMKRWDVPGVPTYVLLGPDGKERKRFVGYVDADTFAAGLDAAAGSRGG
jgi:thiol:disulfide interchange protein DsbD